VFVIKELGEWVEWGAARNLRFGSWKMMGRFVTGKRGLRVGKRGDFCTDSWYRNLFGLRTGGDSRGNWVLLQGKKRNALRLSTALPECLLSVEETSGKVN